MCFHCYLCTVCACPAMARVALWCCCIAVAWTAAMGHGDGLSFFQDGHYNFTSDDLASRALSFQSLPNATKHRLTFWHEPTIPLSAKLLHQELLVDVSGDILLFPARDAAVSVFVVNTDNETIMVSDVYQPPAIPKKITALYNVTVSGHGVTLHAALLEQQTAAGDFFRKVAWWDFRNASRNEAVPHQTAVRINAYTATNDTFANRTGVTPQWLVQGSKHILRANSYEAEGSLYAEKMDRQYFEDEPEQTCKLYKQVIPRDDVVFSCPAGEGRETENAECLVCDQGKFSQDSECRKCPTYQGTKSPGQSTCTPCPAGWYLEDMNSGRCERCAAGTYRDQNRVDEDGELAKNEREDYKESCEDCAAGKYGVSNGASSQSECESCEAGKYSKTVGASNITTCLHCAVGSYSLGGVSECSQCPANRTTHGSQISSDSCKCKQGFFTTDIGTCDECAVGKFSNELGAYQCTNCSTGTAQNRTGQTSCHTCTNTQYAATGATACQNCPGNATTTQGANAFKTDCLCNAGFAGENGSECAQCGLGTYTERPGQGECQNCSGGYFQNRSGMTLCIPCENGKYSEVAQSECKGCPDNSALDPSKDGSRQNNVSDCECRPGFFNNDSTSQNQSCTVCGRGTYTETYGSQTCTNCGIGKFNNATAQNNRTACQQCDLTKFSAAGSVSCTPCPSNATARHQRPNITDCQCNSGYNGSDGGNCTACAPGTYKDELGAMPCTLCSAGTASAHYAAVTVGTCRDCEDTKFAGRGSAECDTCPTDASSVLPRATKADCRCDPGTTGNNGQACEACEVGTYKPQMGHAPCTQCGAGKFSHDSKKASEDTCQECPDAEYAPVGSHSCTPCPTGATSWGERAAVDDCKCRSGFNGTDGHACTGCRAGTFKQVVGEGNCQLCPPGTFSTVEKAEWASSCTPCGVGMYSSAGSTACTFCFANAVSDARSGDIGSCECNVGYGYTAPDICTTCTTAKFKPQRGNHACDDIPTNSQKTSDSGAWECNKGYTLADTDPNQCQACARGSYKSQAGNEACMACIVPKTTHHPGATSSSKCTTSVDIDQDQDGVLSSKELQDLADRTNLDFVQLDGDTNVTKADLVRFIEDVLLELSGDFDQGEVFYRDQSAGGASETFAVDVNVALDALGDMGVEVKDVDKFDENGDDLIVKTEWDKLVTTLREVSEMAQGQETLPSASPPTADTGDSGGIPVGLVAVFVGVFVVLMGIAVMRRAVPSGKRKVVDPV